MQVLQDQAESINKHVMRSVPIAWYGVASEVQLMGSFDGWTQGITLSAEDIGDSVFTKFQADLQLLPVRPPNKTCLQINYNHNTRKQHARPLGKFVVRLSIVACLPRT